MDRDEHQVQAYEFREFRLDVRGRTLTKRSENAIDAYGRIELLPGDLVALERLLEHAGTVVYAADADVGQHDLSRRPPLFKQDATSLHQVIARLRDAVGDPRPRKGTPASATRAPLIQTRDGGYVVDAGDVRTVPAEGASASAGSDGTNSPALLGLPVIEWDAALHPPGALLRADCAQAVPFHYREQEIRGIAAWSEASPSFGLRLYTGRGGIGKTRLFLEVCRLANAKGWRAGFVRTPDEHTAPTWNAFFADSRPALIVFDYAETSWEAVATLLSVARATPDTRVRVVLLARSVGDWWDRLRQHGDGVSEIMSGPAVSWEPLKPLVVGSAERERFFETAATHFAKILGSPAGGLSEGEDLSSGEYDSALVLHMRALAAVEGVVEKGEQGLLGYLLDREQRFWSRKLAEAHLSTEWLRAVATAMATITLRKGALDRAHARADLQRIPLLTDQPELVLDTILRFLHEAYPGGKWIEPVQPDLLGERLIESLDDDDRDLVLNLVFGPSS